MEHSPCIGRRRLIGAAVSMAVVANNPLASIRFSDPLFGKQKSPSRGMSGEWIRQQRGRRAPDQRNVRVAQPGDFYRHSE